MTEIITATVWEPYPPETASHFRDHRTEILHLGQLVEQYLATNDINQDDVLFAGFNREAPKPESPTHWEAGEQPKFYFSDASSLAIADSFSDDPEEQDVHWAVNPLNYAIMQGTLGIYARQKLGEPIEVDPEFGLHLFEISPEDIDAALVAELRLIRE